MKEKDIYVEYSPQEIIYYAEKDDNTYGPVNSGAQLTANHLDDFIEKKKALAASLRKQLIANEISPIYYYAIWVEMGEKDLASRANISVRKLKKYYQPKYFKKLKVEKLKVFADIFDIQVSDFFHSILIKDEVRENLIIEYSRTQNDFFHITKINQKK
jgi:hypothetical protein